MKKNNELELILVGDELLAGEQKDTHLVYLGNLLQGIGLRLARVHVVGDSVDAIASLVAERCPETRVLLLTGGLGPTADDITRDGVARALGLGMEFHEPSWRSIQAFFTGRGKEVTDNNRGQAYFPSGASVLPNRIGTAPGFTLESGGTTVFVLPGPSDELKTMMDAEVVPRLQDVFSAAPLRVEKFRTVGIGESKLTSMILEQLAAVTAYKVSSLPSYTGVDIVLTQLAGVKDQGLLDWEANEIEKILKERIGSRFYERGRRTLVEVLGDLLAERGETVAVAESLTGGWIGKQLTDVSGSSRYFLADAVCYSNESKAEYLGVSQETLERFGAVSEQVCAQMAEGVRLGTRATYGLATTGIAGPTGATPTKPVGLTYLGLSWDGGNEIKRMDYLGNRDGVRRRACQGVLWMLFNHLSG